MAADSLPQEDCLAFYAEIRVKPSPSSFDNKYNVSLVEWCNANASVTVEADPEHPMSYRIVKGSRIVAERIQSHADALTMANALG